MAEALNGLVASFKGNATLSAYRVVARSAANEVGNWSTQSSSILGVTMEDSKATGSAVAIVLGGIAKAVCNASVTAGQIVGPATDGSGAIVERANPNTTTTAFSKTLGIALEAGSTNSVIRVALQINNKSSLG